MAANQANTLFAEQALLESGWATNVLLEWDAAGIVRKITPDAKRPAATINVPVLVPGMANLHCHSFQRAMAGLAEISHSADDSFWSWRDLMYQFVEHLRPGDVQIIASFAYMEMLQSGFTSVGEFHYLHHQTNGTPYDNPAEMANRVIAGAQEAGIEITMLPVFYAHSGFGGAKPGATQQRFVHDVDGFQKLLENLRNNHPDLTLGIAPHSLRATTPNELHTILSANPSGPVHIHIAEQMAEVHACQNKLGARPVRWLLDNVKVDERWCLVHATHLDKGEVLDLAKSYAIAGLCPITEANLGDGIFDGATFLQAGGTLGIGSDSCVRIDLAEELRLLEYGQRLRNQKRAVLAPTGTGIGGHLYRQAALGGARALQQNNGQIAPGKTASFVALDDELPSMTGRKQDALLDAWIFASQHSPVQDVWVAGAHVVKDKKHINNHVITNNYIKLLKLILKRFDA